MGVRNQYREPAGKIAPFAMAAVPKGWLRCNGQAVSRATYAVLFAAIGTTHGVGDGATTFNVPEMRGEGLRGLDEGRGVDAGRVLGSFQADAIQGHWHKVGVDSDDDFNGFTEDGAGPGYEAGYGATKPKARTLITDGVNGEPRVAAETRVRTLAFPFCIKT
jgi:phage-related tail fiber protein